MTTFATPPSYCSPIAAKVIEACERHWEAHKSNCSGFVRAVAADLNIMLAGTANDMVDHIRHNWITARTGFDAREWSEAGYLVLAGLHSRDHSPQRSNGHVAVIVPGPLAHGKYPTAYWGSLGSQGRKAATLNWSWNRTDRDNVIYRALKVTVK